MNHEMTCSVDFVCMADFHYGKWLSLCVRAIQRYHPGSRVYVYDLTPDVDAITMCCSVFRDVIHVPYPSSEWICPSWIDEADFHFFWPRFGIRETIKYWTRRFRYRVTGCMKEGWMIDKNMHVQKTRNFSRIISLKPHVLAHALTMSERNIIFLDVDAIVRGSLMHVFDSSFDIAITCEKPEDVVISANPPECTDRPVYPIRAVNTGVIFLKNEVPVTEFLLDWISEMNSVYDVLPEQTALANLIFRMFPEFFSQRSSSVSSFTTRSGNVVLVKKLPVQVYNETRFDIRTGLLPESARVLHFVGSNKQEKNWKLVCDLIERSMLFN